jgi:hypothetical protein
VPIYRLLEQSGFEPEHTEAIGQAFEEALAALNLSDRNDRRAILLARMIMDLGQMGIRDRDRLRDLVVRSFVELSQHQSECRNEDADSSGDANHRH